MTLDGATGTLSVGSAGAGDFRISGNLKNTDFIMENTFWVGLHPALGEEELNFVTKTIKDCFK